ncbi:EEF1A lysine methyltransferase 4 isoform 3-T3 [Liasis olivaceus]
MEEASRRQRPGSNARYRERGFWDARYEQEGADPTEWFGGLECFRAQLEAELNPGDRILVLGCGNSALSYDLFQLGYTDITNIDYSAVCISSMQDRYAHCSGLHWVVMDARFLTFVDRSFDVVLEKGFLDSMMVEEKDLWNVSVEAKMLLDQVLTEVTFLPQTQIPFICCLGCGSSSCPSRPFPLPSASCVNLPGHPSLAARRKVHLCHICPAAFPQAPLCPACLQLVHPTRQLWK